MYDEETTFIIAGMHRSGTSLTTALVQSAGVGIGKDLIGALPSNQLGHFENRDFMLLNETILNYAGGSWCSIPNRDKLDSAFLNNEYYVMNVIQKNRINGLWGWKDPRNSLFFDKYVSYVNNPRIIICWRNPYSIAESLNKRDRFDIQFALELCNTYNRFIIENLKRVSCPVLHIKYEDYFNSDKNVRLLNGFIGANVDPTLIKQELRNF